MYVMSFCFDFNFGGAIISRADSIKDLRIVFDRKMTFGSSKLNKPQIIITKYVKYLKRYYPTEFADSTQNHNKNIRTPDQQIRTNFAQKKVCLLTSKTIGLKLNSKNLNLKKKVSR
jgi:hypothetical protein